MPTAPVIGIVVVHYGTDELTLRCLRSLSADSESPPSRLVLVDNGPGPGFARQVRVELPQVLVLGTGQNLGFAAGCNLGISALAEVPYIALVNSDMEVPRGWLTPLLDTLEADARCASASPKIRFDGRFHTIEIVAEPSWRPGRGDRRELTWRLEGASIGGRDVMASCQLVEGFWEPRPSGIWAGERAVLRVPSDPTARVVDLIVGTPPGQGVRLRTADGTVTEVPPGGGRFSLALGGDAVPVINNVGTSWRDDGYGIDVGFQEVDEGQHDRPAPVQAWCGGAVLLRRNYLSQMGGFDGRLFLYYEDLELSLRGASSGWWYAYDPRSVVAHRHAASSAQQPQRVARLKERNRLLVVARHGTIAQLGAQLLRFAAVTWSYLQRDVVAAILRGDKPWWGEVRTRAGAMAGALALLPAMLRARRLDRRARAGMDVLA